MNQVTFRALAFYATAGFAFHILSYLPSFPSPCQSSLCALHFLFGLLAGLVRVWYGGTGAPTGRRAAHLLSYSLGSVPIQYHRLNCHQQKERADHDAQG